MKPLLTIALALLWALAPAPALAQSAAAPRAKLVQDYAPRPAIWLLADEDTKIYLFGTTHMLPPGFKWRSPALDKVVKEAGELVVETYIEPGDDAADMALVREVMLDTPVPILSRVPAEKRPALQAAMDRAKMPAAIVSNLKTWAAAVILGLSDQLRGWGADNPDDAPGVEDGLEEDFRTAGKPIHSVESPKAGLDAFNALTEEEQVALLLEDLEEPVEKTDSESAENDRLWATGRFEEAAVEAMKEFPPVLFDGLVTKRNAAWTDWLVARLDKPGTIVFAVGAAHLAGDVSVQNMLAKRGYKVARFD